MAAPLPMVIARRDGGRRFPLEDNTMSVTPPGDLAYNGVGDERGAADLYLGAGGRLGPAPDQLLPNPTEQPIGCFGNQVALCDLDSDGYDERIVAAVRQDHPADEERAVFIYAGSPAPVTVPGWELDSPTNRPRGAYGRIVSCGR